MGHRPTHTASIMHTCGLCNTVLTYKYAIQSLSRGLARIYLNNLFQLGLFANQLCVCVWGGGGRATVREARRWSNFLFTFQ